MPILQFLLARIKISDPIEIILMLHREDKAGGYSIVPNERGREINPPATDSRNYPILYFYLSYGTLNVSVLCQCCNVG
jgi:hypothetical protein